MKELKNHYFFRNNGENIKKYINLGDIDDLLVIGLQEEIEGQRRTRLVDELASKSFSGRMIDWMQEEDLILRSNGTIEATPVGYDDYNLRILSLPSFHHLYRGENKKFLASVPSLNRQLTGFIGIERELRRVVAYARAVQFFDFLLKFEITKFWLGHVCDINYLALAQHYGFPTELFDLTHDIRVALFFATCKYIPKTDSYVPLSQADIDADEESKYGCIFHTPNWVINWNDGYGASRISMIQSKRNHKPLRLCSGDLDNIALQIGYQPFYRCHYQRGYIMPDVISKFLQEQPVFEKLYFKQSPELSQWVFDAMNQEKSIFPYEGLTEARPYIEYIKQNTIFSKDDICHVYENEYIGKTTFNSLQDLLKKIDGYHMDDKLIKIVDHTVEIPLPLRLKKEIDKKYNCNDIFNMISKIHIKPQDRAFRQAIHRGIYKE